MEKKAGILFVIITILFSTQLFAQRTTDIGNSKDHPLISRFDKAVIEFYKETNWGSYKLPVNVKGTIDWENPQPIEGKVTRIQYTATVDNNSEFVLHNYRSAFNKTGFKVLISIVNEELGVSDRPHTWGEKYYETGGYYNGLNNKKFGMGINLPLWKNNHSFIAATGEHGGKTIYAIVYTIVDEKYTLITQDIVEVEAVETGMVTAEDISKGIQSEGHIAIYDILFETGKYIIKPESEASLKNIAEYINSNTEKKFFIVGHTDNVGIFTDNMTLSQNRAKSVMETLVSKFGVKSERISAHGVASLAPVANNSTDEGKTKNRRVEIVEQ